MSAANRRHGKNGKIEWDSAGGSSFAEMADAYGWSLNMTKDKQKATAFGDTNHVKVVGLPDFSGTIKARYASDSAPLLVAAILGSTAVNLRLFEDRLAATYYHQGLAYLDGSIDVDNEGVVNLEASWDAAANWTQSP